MKEDGSFLAFKAPDQEFATKEFMDRSDRVARQGYSNTDDPGQKQYGMDAMWYLWCSAQSPLFWEGQDGDFEGYFVADPAAHVEKRNSYYALRDNQDATRRILKEFGPDPDARHIINGHVPVRVRRGESPVTAAGRKRWTSIRELRS